MALKDMLKQSASIHDIAAHLDALSATQRDGEVFALGRAYQRKLYERAADAPDLVAEHFVPAATQALTPVVHAGKNTLPLPGNHRRFEKCFTRPRDGDGLLFGYNEAPSRKLIGPGYFVVDTTERDARWRERGSLVVDYFRVPDAGSPVPDGWPKVVPNSVGLQLFVYHRTRDFMRRVSEHVSIGAAYKGEKSLDHYFVLVRRAN